MTTLSTVELGVLGALQVRQYGLPVSIPGAKPRAILAMLGLHGGSVVSSDTLVELLWGDDPPRTAAKALQTHISALRRTLGDGFVLTEGTGWTLSTTEIDATRYKVSARRGRDAVAAGDTSQAVARFDEALTLWRGTPELPDSSRGVSEKTRWIEGHAALVEDRADALLATGRAAEIIGDLEAAVADAPLRERRWGQLMLALYRAGRQGEALGAYQRARSLLVDELGVDPSPDLRRLEAAIVAQDDALEIPVSQQLSSVTRAVTFLLTDIEGSTAAWEADADAMALALARHDEVVEQVVTSRGGRLIKTRGEGDATFSVFDRPSAAAAAAIELQEAIRHEPWALADPMRIRISLHTGEVELRDGDYFGRAVNRAARLKSLAAGGQILCSGATAELVIDSLSDDVLLVDLGMRQLKNLARPEHVFELRLENADATHTDTAETPLERPGLPPVLSGSGPFVGRGPELERLLSAWQTAVEGGAHAVLIAGEPGVGKTRLAGEWSRHAYEQGAIVLYGRCDEDLGAPYQPFAEALRPLIPSLGAGRLRGLRGVEALLSLVPGLTEVLPDLAAPARADPGTERYALFDAVVAVLSVASTGAPVVLILDDLHWAAKPTLLLLRHLLRFGEHAHVQIVGTYRSTDLDRSHPLAAMLADLNRDGSATRLQLSGLDDVDVSAYLAEAGFDDEELARALASVTGGNPFFLIEALRHVEESGGHWDPSTLPQGVREAVSRRLSRLPAETNKALAAAAVVGSRFALELVERVLDDDLVDAFDEACKAGIVIEEPGGRYRFNHAIVRQSLLAELASVRRMRLHQRIAATLETDPGADDELLAELAYHYFECAWAGNAAKAVDYCRRAADQAMARLAYEGAADLYDRAVHALEEVDEELPDRDDQQAELLIARCEALLAAGDVVSAAGAVSQLQAATRDSTRLAAWGACFDGQLSMLTDPERLDEIESELAAAAEALAGLDDAAGEAKAHTVRAGCLARLGRIGDCETALDHALTAARRAREHRRVNAVLAGAPLAALWGPNPVPRAGGRCLDVVRLLRITTGSPVVEATSTRCQAVLDALRGRAAAGRSLLDSARRALTELGMRHALLEVDQFAGILELIAGDPAAAEPHLRRACNGFRRMGLDADTAETAALLARACLALDRDAEADELCTESERLAGHALKASIAWRTVRAQLLARSGIHDEARRVAEEAVAVAERTDALVDRGDACLALATVLEIAGDGAGARAAAEKAVGLYELKGAAALAEKTRKMLGVELPGAQAEPEAPSVALDNECMRVARRAMTAINREALDEAEQLWASDLQIESRRKVVRFAAADLPPDEWYARRALQVGGVRVSQVVIATQGERLALTRTAISTTDLSPGAPSDEFLRVFGINQEGRICLEVWFDLDDMDAAIAELDAVQARMEEQYPRAPLANAATWADSRLNALFAERRWDDIGVLLTDDLRVEDRRQGLGRIGTDRATELAEVRTIADLGTATMTSEAIAIRGERLALVRTRYSGRSQAPDAFHTVVLRITEVGGDGRIVALIAFDLDDIDAAFEELDARYLAGDAVPYAHTWSLILRTYAAVNRHELPPTTPDHVSLDHHRASFAPGDLVANLRAGWSQVPDFRFRVEAVHRLSDLGAVVTHTGRGTSLEGFEAEWREIHLTTVEGELFNRNEMFDEADLDAALLRFDELSRPVPRLDNVASQVADRFLERFVARAWDAMAQMVTDDISFDDRRRVVNADLQIGRDLFIENFRTAADLGAAQTLNPIATRGDRVVLTRARFSRGEGAPEEFGLDLLHVIEIGADERIAATVTFDPEDIDAAFAELDARYLAGEAAPYGNTWSVIVGVYVAHNRRELAPTTPDVVSIDHRRVAAFAPGAGIEYIRAGWDLDQRVDIYIEAVHRLSDFGMVFSFAGNGASHEGFAAEWRGVNLLAVDADKVSRSEIFDEADLDAALARFDELSRPALRLENAASQVYESLWTFFAARDWAAIAAMLADDSLMDDRRRVVNAGVRQGRDALIVNGRALAEVGLESVKSVAIATRGMRLVLCRTLAATSGPEAYDSEALHIVDIDADDRISAVVMFDVDDIDAAFEELDARYLASEAGAHARTWSVIADAYASFNRRELPATTRDWVNVDHRRAVAFAPGEMSAFTRAAWDLTPHLDSYIETVHRLSNLGVVVTHASLGASREGFAAEWREIGLFTVEGDLISRFEVFDEEDLHVALASFDELNRPTPHLENAASQLFQRYWACFATRDWATLVQLLGADAFLDDRRRVVNSGARHDRDSEVASLRALADLGVTNVTSTAMATRGGRLALTRVGSSAFETELLNIVEIGDDGRIVALIAFDLDDIDAALAELDARYIAGAAAEHAHTWSVIVGALASVNRHEVPDSTPDWVNVDHRRAIAFAPGDMTAYMHATWDEGPDGRAYIEAVHRLSNLGAIVTQVGRETSPRGFEAEWRLLNLLTVEGDQFNRCELFDEADLDAALAKFGEINRPAPRLENAASQAYQRFQACFAARNWAAVKELLAEDISNEDRRRVVSAGTLIGPDATVASLRASADLGLRGITSAVIATRGRYLALSRDRFDVRDHGFEAEVLGIVELNANGRCVARVVFDIDDIDAALVDVDARYLAGEAAAHARTWSVIAEIYAGLNRHEVPATTPDWINVDRRRVTTMAPGDMIANLRAGWDLMPQDSIYIEAVHRLTDLGAVVTHSLSGTTQGGFQAEWRMLNLLTLEGDRINRSELFDEADVDVALARFDELSMTARPLDNAATRAWSRVADAFNRRDFDGLFALTTADARVDDRRKGLQSVFEGAASQMNVHQVFELTPASWRMAVEPLAVRGSRLSLSRGCLRDFADAERPITLELLNVVEVDDDGLIHDAVSFDPDDLDAAFDELDARYLAGEAAAHARTWSVISGAIAATNRHEDFSTTPDWVNVNHHRATSFEPGELTAYIRSSWEDMPGGRTYIEAVHRLSNLGAVITHRAEGATTEGFEAEWRGIDLMTVAGDLISRSEMFEEADLDAALARFDELSAQRLS